jgi:hypothetical protein
MPTAHYIAHGLEALQVIEHTLHHLDLDHLDATEGRDFARFERNREWFENTFRRDREKADEAWDLLIGPLLNLIEAAGDESDELEQHRDDLIALSEDYLGTHHNRDGFAGQDDREDNPSKAILNRRRAILHDVIRKALELAPPSIDREFVRAALGPVVEQIVNPPKPAKAPKAAKVKPEKAAKTLKEGEVGGETHRLVVLYPTSDIYFRKTVQAILLEPAEEVNGYQKWILQAQPIGFYGVEGSPTTRAFSLVKLADKSVMLVDRTSGTPIQAKANKREALEYARLTWSGALKEGYDLGSVLDRLGTAQDCLDRGREATSRLASLEKARQQTHTADALLITALVDMQRLMRGSPSLATMKLPRVPTSVSLSEGLDFMTEWSWELTAQVVKERPNQKKGDRETMMEGLRLAEAMYQQAKRNTQLGRGEKLDPNAEILGSFYDAVNRGQSRVEDWGDDRLKAEREPSSFNAWKRNREKEAEAERIAEAEEAAERERTKKAAAEKAARPEEQAFRKWYHSYIYEDFAAWRHGHYGHGPKHSGVIWKRLKKLANASMDPGVSGFAELVRSQLHFKFGDPPVVDGDFLKAAIRLRQLDATVTDGKGQPGNELICSFVDSGSTRATVKAKATEPAFYLFHFLRFWHDLDKQQPRESNPYDLHLSREENPARERVSGGRELIGEKVTVYRNLHLDTFSVRLGTKVVLHSDYVKLRNAKFVVQAGGRDTVRRTGAKLVHAYIGGILEDFAEEGEAPAAPSLPHPVGYNPYKDDTFVARDSGDAAFTASEVELLGTRAYAKGLNGRVENPAHSGMSSFGLLTGAVLGAFVMHRLAKR